MRAPGASPFRAAAAPPAQAAAHRATGLCRRPVACQGRVPGLSHPDPSAVGRGDPGRTGRAV